MKDLKEKELYEKIYAKQMKYLKKMFCIIFMTIGLIFMIMGAILLIAKVVDEEGFMVGTVFLPMGLIFIASTLPFLFIPTKGNYERFKKRTSKYGYVETYDALIKIAILDEQCKELEKRIEELEN